MTSSGIHILHNAELNICGVGRSKKEALQDLNLFLDICKLRFRKNFKIR